MSFQTALTQLSQLAVAGIAHNYSLATLPDSLTRAHLPCLIVSPIDPRQDRFARDSGAGFVASAFGNGVKTVTYQVTHVLAVTFAHSKIPLRAHLPTLIDHIDHYFLALKEDVLLGDTLAEPAHVRVQIGTFSWQDHEFYGCLFHHTWLLEV